MVSRRTRRSVSLNEIGCHRRSTKRSANSAEDRTNRWSMTREEELVREIRNGCAAAFLECFAGREKLGGKTIILVDVSGSMDSALSAKSEMRRMDVACSLAMIGREMFEELRVFTFSNSLVEVPGRRGFALRDAITGSQPHGGTELGKAVGSNAGALSKIERRRTVSTLELARLGIAA